MNWFDSYLRPPLSVAIVLTGPLWFGLAHQPAEMGLAIVAGGIAAAFLNLSAFAKFKGAGFEAELRSAVDEAHATVAQLKRVVRPLLLFTMDQLAYSGRFGKSPNLEKVRKSVEDLAEGFNLSEDPSFQSALAAYIRLEIWDRYAAFVSHINLTDRLNELGAKLALLERRESIDFPSIHNVESLLEEEEPSVKSRELLAIYIVFMASNSNRLGSHATTGNVQLLSKQALKK